MAAAAPALIVVADAGPIIHLSWLDRLDLLDAMFQDVLIPEVVQRELLPPGRVLPGADAVALALRAGRLRVRPVQDRARVALLRANIDQGEAEALALSEEVGAGLVLLDDRRARDVAERLGLRFIGTIGLLRQARWQGLVRRPIHCWLSFDGAASGWAIPCLRKYGAMKSGNDPEAGRPGGSRPRSYRYGRVRPTGRHGMIVFLNGAFGVGKTTLAERLVARLPDSLLYDAEEVGYFLGKIVAPIDRPDDFQHLPIWRSLTVTTAHLLRQTYGRTLVMPMTIWHRPYFDEVLGGLRAGDPEVYHFSLTATAGTLAERLRRRGDSPEVFAWCWARAERCIAAFQDPVFAVQIPTDGKTPGELTAEILARLPPTAGGGR